MRCSLCHHSYIYKAQTSWLVFENECHCECHTYPGKYPTALPGSYPDDFVTVPLDNKVDTDEVKDVAEQKRVRAQKAKERAAEERARAVWDSQGPMPEDKPANKPKPRRVKVPYVDEPPFNDSTLSIRRQSHSLPHLIDYRRSGFENGQYVNQLPFRRVPNWSRSSRCTSRPKTGLEKLRETGAQLRAFQRGMLQDTYVVSPAQDY